MKVIRLKSVLFLLPLLVFFCQYQNGYWCTGNNDDGAGNVNHPEWNASNNFAIGNNCPADFPYPNIGS